ncbi:hypothetical protein GAY28_37285 [Azospirillum brasilense]|nr:hypothetical protein [Azospirillum brasilense]
MPGDKRSAGPGDLAVWMMEPALPRVIRAITGDKVILVEPGDETANLSRRVSRAAIAPVDLQALYA